MIFYNKRLIGWYASYLDTVSVPWHRYSLIHCCGTMEAPNSGTNLPQSNGSSFVAFCEVTGFLFLHGESPLR